MAQRSSLHHKAVNDVLKVVIKQSNPQSLSNESKI